jgi:hypothetical protein
MGESERGEHIPPVPSQHPESELPFTERLVVSVLLSGTGTRPILLQLDFGSDGPILYASREETKLRPDTMKTVFCQPCSSNAYSSAVPTAMWFLILDEAAFLISHHQCERRRIA